MRRGRLGAIPAMLLRAMGCGQEKVQEVPRSEDLRIGVHSLPLSLDPHEKNEVLAFAVLFNVYDRLTEFDAGMRAGPSLAVGWESPGDLTWRFDLRPGVVFHDGRLLTSADVVASLQRARSPASEMSSFLADVEQVRAVDEDTVEIVTASPTPTLPNKLAFIAILPEDAPEEIVDPVGTGAYRFAGEEGEAVLLLERFEDSWHSPGVARRAEFHAIAEPEERLAALRAGEVDLIHEVPPELLEAAAADPAIDHLSVSSLQVVYLHLSPREPPFDDLRVRRAFDLALNRQQIVDEVLLGYGLPASQMVSPEALGFDPAFRGTRYDPEEARRLLAEAGYDGSVEVTLEYRESRDAGWIGRQLGEVGVHVELRPQSWQEVYERLVSDEGIPFYLGGIVSTTGDGSDVLDVFAHTYDRGGGRGRGNHIGYSNPELDAMIDRASAEVQAKSRRDLLQACFRRLAEDAVYLPLMIPYENYLLSADLQWKPGIVGLLEIRKMRWQS